MIKVRIDASKLNTAWRRNRAMSLIERLEYKLNSDEFKQGILNMPDKYRNCEVSKYKNYSNLEIYNHLMSGKEEWNDEVDHEWDIYLDDYTNNWSRVLGKMTPGKKMIYENTKYFDTLPLDDLDGHVAHEASHTFGFRHAGYDLKLSFSYYIGKLVKSIRMPGDDRMVTYKTVCERLWYTLWIKKRCWMVKV